MKFHFASIILGLLVVTGIVRGQDAPEIRAMPLFSPATYTGNQWFASRIELVNPTNAPIAGQIELPATGGGATAKIAVATTVPPMSRVRRPALTWLPDNGSGRAAAAGAAMLDEIEWRTSGGQLIARTEMFGMPVAVEAFAPATREGVILVVQDATSQIPIEGDEWDFPRVARDATQSDLTQAFVDFTEFPRQRAALEMVRIIVLQYLDPDRLDSFQRKVLLDFVSSGGMVIVSSPDASVQQSWLGDLLPVQLVGNRESSLPNGLDLLEPVPLSEAVAADRGTVVLRDDSYVHAAYVQRGLGRIVYTSFPVGAMKPEEANRALVAGLLQFAPLYTDWSSSALPEMRDSLLTRLIGKSAPPWRTAAAIAGGYALLLVVLQVVLGGASRPRAFLVSTVLAVVVTGALMVMAAMRQQTDISMQGTVATLDVSPTGGGLYQENTAFVGPAGTDLKLRPADSLVTVRPVAIFGTDPVRLEFPVQQMTGPGLKSDRFEQIWYASRAVGDDKRLVATLTVVDNGVRVVVDNQLGATLRSAGVSWGQYRLLLNDLPVGRTEVNSPTIVNATTESEGGAVVTSEQKMRQQFLASSLGIASRRLGARPIASPVLTGWLDESISEPLLATAVDASLDRRSQVLVRTPVAIEPASVGQTVQLPSAAVVMTPDQSATLLYNPYNRTWQEVRGPGQFLLGFSAPAELGHVNLTRAVGRLNIRAPQHKITLQAGQVRNGKGGINPVGRTINEWSRPVGVYTFDIELTAADLDPQGRFWLLIKAEQEQAALAEAIVVPPWQIESFEIDLTGQVTAAPAPAQETASAN